MCTKRGLHYTLFPHINTREDADTTGKKASTTPNRVAFSEPSTTSGEWRRNMPKQNRPAADCTCVHSLCLRPDNYLCQVACSKVSHRLLRFPLKNQRPTQVHRGHARRLRPHLAFSEPGPLLLKEPQSTAVGRDGLGAQAGKF